MNPSTLRLLAVAPLALYLTAVSLPLVFAGGPLAVGAAILAALPAMAVVRQGRSWWTVAPAVVLFGYVAIDAALSGGAPLGPAAGLLTGLLVGAPALGLGVLVLVQESAGGSLALFSGYLAGGATTLALVESFGYRAPTGGAPQVAGRLGAIAGAQLRSLGEVLAGTPPGPIPLAGALDPAFVGLGLLALIGVLLSLAPDPAGPPAALAEPTSRTPSTTSPRRPPSDFALPAALRAWVRSHEDSQGSPPPADEAVVQALGLAALSTVAYLAAAVLVPHLALLGVSLGIVLGLVVATLAARRRPSRSRPPARRSAPGRPFPGNPSGEPGPAPTAQPRS